MTVTLTITAGPEQGLRVLCDRELVIGREGADVVLTDEEVSRTHVRVRPVEQGIEIEDLGSKNGTFVNGERVAGMTLVSSRAELKVGTTTFAVEMPDAVETADRLAPDDNRSPEVKARQEALTAIRDAPPPEGPPRAEPPGGVHGPPGGDRPRGGPPGGGPPGGGPPGGGPSGRRPPPPIRLLRKTPIGRMLMRRRMARMAKRGGPPGPPQ